MPTYQEPTLHSFDEELEELPMENIFKRCRKSFSQVSLSNSNSIDDSCVKKFKISQRRNSDFGGVLPSSEKPGVSWRLKVTRQDFFYGLFSYFSLETPFNSPAEPHPT